MFRFTEPSSDQIENTVMVHSVSVRSTVFLSGLMMVQWTETCRRNFQF